MRRPRLSQSFLMAIFLATAAAARAPPSLFERASGTCADTTYSLCPQAGLPAGFCCPPTSICIPLAANTTVLCCQVGDDCSTVEPITCDITAQNPDLHPDNVLKTTYLNMSLPTCGSSCCPWGFTCNSANNCVENADQNLLPGQASSSSVPTPTSTKAPVTIIPTPSSSTAASATTICSKFPIGAILLGFFPGLFLGLILMLGTCCVLENRNHKNSRRRSGSSFGNISEPHPISDNRTDFLRKPPQTPSTVGGGSVPSRRQTLTRVRSFFGRSPQANGLPSSPRPVPPMPLNIRRPAATNDRPVTPMLQREPSYEDINIFANEDTLGSNNSRGGRESHMTTFGDMMQRSGSLAGLPKGKPYIYKGSPQS